MFGTFNFFFWFVDVGSTPVLAAEYHIVEGISIVSYRLHQ